MAATVLQELSLRKNEHVFAVEPQIPSHVTHLRCLHEAIMLQIFAEDDEQVRFGANGAQRWLTTVPATPGMPNSTDHPG